METVRRMRAEAAVLRGVISRSTLGVPLPEGRTREVVELVNLKLQQAYVLLRDEATELERYERIEANS
jgi:hypothetical protein